MKNKHPIPTVNQIGYMIEEADGDIQIHQKFVKLEKYKKFYNHIKAHFEKEHPGWKVKCKICDKTFEEIVNEQ